MTSPIFTHDPDFPFLLVHKTAGVLAKFKTEQFAIDRSEGIAFADRYSVVDTTPKPRIPVDAQFITWARYQMKHFAYRYRDLWVYNDKALYEEALLQDWVGDSKVIVLDPRQEKP